ncbi:MAG: aminotransferase class V-fold PLP-dependent enzyme [Alphaproteobacteria bacterium]|nr:aminotransferase class V-fold PLP-dependent enzyme [Alphaproteobacteria bacterium]
MHAAMNDFPFGAAIRHAWDLDPTVAYLNHGSFGVTPRTVLEAQAKWRHEIERSPAAFMARARAGLLRDAAAPVAEYLGAQPEDLAFMENATSAANAVLRSLAFSPGDEILVTSLGYRAVNHAAAYVATRAGATLVEAKITLPVGGADDIVAAVTAKLSARTRLVVLDHIASQSAIVLPIEPLIAAARGVGAQVLIDGAHVPGQLTLDIPALGADYYVANLHKWLFVPRGCAVLWAPKARQDGLQPLTISHGYGQGFLAEFDWTGTRDLSGWLCAPEGIAAHRRLGAERLMERNRAFAREMATMLARRFGTGLAAPLDMFAAMAVVRLPDSPRDFLEVTAWLRETHRIEAPVWRIDGALWVRIGAQAYNEPADYERLAAAIESGL